MQPNGDKLRVFRPFMADVVNHHRAPGRAGKEGTFYVGRGSQWGNPYRIDQDNSREAVILRYLDDIIKMNTPEVRIWLKPIAHALRRGYKLRCYCAPQDCHAMILARYARLFHGLPLPAQEPVKCP